MGVVMKESIRSTGLGTLLNAGIGIVFIIAAVILVMSVNYSMRRQALIEAEAKARIILDRNLATHTYFSQIMKPSIFTWSEPFRSKEHFDPTWMSSTYAIREIEKYFKAFNPSGYSFKDAAINARCPENEADAYERAFLEKLGADKKLIFESAVRMIDGKPYFVVLRKGEAMEPSCLRCHSAPRDAPKGLTDIYGSERSFKRNIGDVVSAVSLRIPLSESFAAANIFSLKLSAILLIVLAGLYTIQSWFYRHYLLKPLETMQEKATQIVMHEKHLGEQISQPVGMELIALATAFNEMSVKLRHDRDHLEELVDKRTAALRESETRYRELSIIDGLTQLYNSRYFYQQLKMEIGRVNRYKEPLTLLLLDLDDFKAFNDAYGHVEGDQALWRFGQVVKRCLRQTDSAYRYGGEEFTVLLPITTSEKGSVIAERIRTELKKESFSPAEGKVVHMTASIGIAQYKIHEDMKSFMQRADQLMYQAKKNGKDRVCIEVTEQAG